MPKVKRELVKHVFKGGRFDDHGIDLDVLPDLLAYKNLLVETAKELWRSKHPGRERLPRNFEESLVVKFYEVEPGSAIIPLVHEYEADDQTSLIENDNELEEAVELVAETAEAAYHDRPIPNQFPTRLLPWFEGYGKTLREGEYYELQTKKRTTPARYDAVVRERLVNWSASTYEDAIDLIGTVTMADISRPRMAITLKDGKKVDAPFKIEDEETVLTALSKHSSARLRLKGRGQFSKTGALMKITATDGIGILPAGELKYDETVKPIWQVFEEIVKTIPADELAKIPTDASENLDHYLYGFPKRKS